MGALARGTELWQRWLVARGGSSLWGAAFLFVFSLPFIGAGGFLLAIVAGLFDGSGSSDHPVALAMSGTLFLLVGGALAALAVFGNAAQRRLQAIQTQYPEQPWRWREDWAHGVARQRGRASSIGAVFMAVFWNLLAWIGVVLGVPGLVDEGRWFALAVVLLFPAVGLLLAYRAVMAVARQAKFGSAVLHAASFPIRRGGELAGVVHVEGPVESPVQLRLVCQRRVTSGSGDDVRTDVTDLGVTAATVAAGEVASGPRTSRIPVRLAVHRDAPDTFREGGNCEIRWTLRISADLIGVDLNADIEVPVYGEHD